MKDFTDFKKQRPIADFHCDLLLYLSRHPTRSAYDTAVRCSIPQLKEGNVKIQVMAIFAETERGSSDKGFAQAEIFRNLPKVYPDIFEIIHQTEALQAIENSPKIGILPAIENASAFCDEQESLEEALQRFESLQHKIGKMAYVSLTWNTENRFGGGAHTKIGLKKDGERLIEHLSNQSIVLDMSHASDYLAYDALNYIEKKGLILPIVASHSNFRSIANVPRNLPDDLALEILKREGVIGLNFVRLFVGSESETNFLRQLEYALKFQRKQGLCFGADFFYEEDVSLVHRKPVEELFFPNFDHAGTYGKVIHLWKEASIAAEKTIEDICFNNLKRFLLKNICNN